MRRALALLAAAALAGPVALAGAGAAGAAGDGVVDRTVKDGRIAESSGLTPSLLHPGVIWTHNDSGNAPRIYAIGPDGSTAAAVTLEDEPGVDWEAITSLRVPGAGGAGGPLIAVGDIGDNTASHPNVRIAILDEPPKLRTESVRPERVLKLRYPAGPRDAEALLADPFTGQLYLVSKQLLGADLYAVPRSLWPGPAGDGGSRVSKTTTLRKVASLSTGLITDGAFLPDGRMLLRGYGRVFVVARPATVRDGRLETLASAALPYQDQGEGIAVADGGRAALLSSEGRREPVLRISVPEAPGAGPTATRPNRTGTPADGGRAAGRPAQPSSAGVGTIRLWTLVAGAALVLTAGTLLVIMLRPRR